MEIYKFQDTLRETSPVVLLGFFLVAFLVFFGGGELFVLDSVCWGFFLFCLVFFQNGDLY